MTDPRTRFSEPQDAVPDQATVHLAKALPTPAPESPATPAPAPPAGHAATVRDTAVTLPDRVEGDVLRFGPGVTGTVLPAVGEVRPAAGRRGYAWLRRYAPAAAVLAAVLAFLAWQRLGPDLAVREVSVRIGSTHAPGCDGTADVVGVVRTNGAGGTIGYRWLRSDGSTSGLLHEKVPAGEREARLHLRWTFRGEGDYRARAELRIVSPATPKAARSAAVRFTYSCP